MHPRNLHWRARCRRTGDKEAAKEHFKLFQHMTSTKISAAIGLAYGEQGHYSTVTPVEEPQARQRAMIPVKLVEHSAEPANRGNTVAVDHNGRSLHDGCDRVGTDGLGSDGIGAQAIRVLHRTSQGGFEDVDAAAAGLKVSGRAVACAVGDYDGDNLNDLAVALDDGVRLFRNLGKGKFEDVTAEAGLAARNRPTGITFVDYDHDGDLDLFLTGAPLKDGDAPNVLWRNNGNKTFTEWTAETGLGGAGKTASAILTDFNNDRAVDLAVTGDGIAPVLFVNPREGKYPQQASVRGRKVAGDGGHCGPGLQQGRVDGHCRDPRRGAGIDAVAQCGGSAKHGAAI